MNNGKRSSLKIEEFYKKTKELLKLKPVINKTPRSRKIGKFSSSKSFHSVKTWGKREIQYLEKLSANKRREFLKKSLEDNPSCLVLTDSLTFFPEIKNEAKNRRLALFSSELTRRRFQEKANKFFLSLDSGEITISGELLQIFGLGVLIMGDSGIGKSESALELLTRGHPFVSDDVVRIKKAANKGILIGMSPALSRYFMEIRGLGLINIKEIFGSKIVLKQTKIDLAIDLKKWQQEKEYDRIGLKFAEDYVILGEKIPQLNIPVAPGRNIATLIEVACKVHILRRKGYRAPEEIIRKLNRALSHPYKLKERKRE